MAVSEEWIEWTRSNFAQGCLQDDIVEILKENGFSDSDVKYAIKKALSAKEYRRRERQKALREKLNGRNPAVDYQKMAYPVLVRSEGNANISTVKNDHLQIYKIEDFLSENECDALIGVINSRLRPSTITSGEDRAGLRTSSTCDLARSSAPEVKALDKKIEQTLGISAKWSEENQGQKYLVGQEFKEHTDYFEPNSDEFKKYAEEKGQRTWTFMVYLNDTSAGGETYFTKIDKSFRPKKGLALAWNNLNPDGTVNSFSEHQGMPVKEGEKIIITKWFRDRRSKR